MSTRIIQTKDGSHTLYHAELNQSYHSVFGAAEESMRIFIELGLWPKMAQNTPIRVFEMGFGTGLNALLTALEAEKRHIPIAYTTIEAFPIPLHEADSLNYNAYFQTTHLTALHHCPWEEKTQIHPFFSLQKKAIDLAHFATTESFDLVYYDAFSPDAQPEMWTSTVFEKIANMMTPGGYLCTYCTKVYVQRNLREAGFTIEKHKGPPRKREVLRAIKR